MKLKSPAIAFLLLFCASLARANGTPTRIDPDHVIAGSPSITLTITGSGFNGFESLLFNGTSYGVSFVSSQEITATIPAAQLKAIGSYAVYVNSNPSQVFRFRVLSPLSSIWSYVPSQFVTPVNTPITVYGSDFNSSSTILFDWQPLTTTFVSTNQLTATVPSTLITASQTHHVLVFAGAFTAASIATLQSLPVIGTDQPQISISNVVIGTSLTGTATVRSLQNTTTLSNPFYAISGPDSADFSKTGGTCANGKILPVGASCTVQVTATPAAFPAPPPSWLPNNSYALNTIIVDNANVDPNGTPHLQKVTAAGTSEVGVSPIAGGPALPDFLWNESGGITADGSVVWTDQGPYVLKISESATLAINSNAANNPQSVPLNLTKTVASGGSGSLSIGAMALNPAGYDFGSVTQSTPTTRTITLQNGGGGYMNLSTPFYALSGTNASDFSIPGGTCSSGEFLNNGNGTTTNPGQKCTFNLTFTPSATGTRSATLTINWTSIGGTVGSASQVLTGTGKTAGTKIHLSWTASASGSVTGYKVYRGNQGGPYSLLASPGNVTSYDDTTPVHGNTYCYVITTVGSNPPYTTTESANSAESCATF